MERRTLVGRMLLGFSLEKELCVCVCVGQIRGFRERKVTLIVEENETD